MPYAAPSIADCCPLLPPLMFTFFLLIEQIECHSTRVSADEDDNLLWRWHMHQRMYIYMCVCLWVYVFTFVFPFLFCRPFRMLLVVHSWYFCIIFECYPLPSIGKESKKCICFPTILGVVLRSVTVAASASAATALLLFEHIFVCQQKSFEWWMAKVHGRVRADVGRGGGLVEWFVESFFLLPLLHVVLIMWVWDIHTICPYLLIRMKRKQDKTKTKSIKIFP